MGRSELLDFEIVKKRARELRSKATSSETLLWKELRNRKRCGYKFLRQRPIAYNPYNFSSFALLCNISYSRTEKFLNI